jgi:hypothetical protein
MPSWSITGVLDEWRDSLGIRARLVQHVIHLLAHLVQAHAQTLEHAGRDALTLSHQAQEQVFGANIVVVEAAGFLDGELNDLLGSGGQPDIAGYGALTAPDDELHGAADLVQVDAQVREHLGGYTLTLSHQPQEQMLGTDVIVVEALRLFLR